MSVVNYVDQLELSQLHTKLKPRVRFLLLLRLRHLTAIAARVTRDVQPLAEFLTCRAPPAAAGERQAHGQAAILNELARGEVRDIARNAARAARGLRDEDEIMGATVL